jgi:hypothetical protein
VQFPRPVRKPVGAVAQALRRVHEMEGEAAQVPRRVRKPVGQAPQVPHRVRELIGEMKQIPGRECEQVSEAARTQSVVRKLALALAAQKPRRRLVRGQPRDLSQGRKFVLMPNAMQLQRRTCRFVPARRLLPNVT